jgi:signal transduction histidine kinase
MIFKYLYSFILFFIVLTSCQHKKIPQGISSSDSTSLYIQKALSNKTPYALRVAYTQKAVNVLAKQENDSLNRHQLIEMCRNFYNLNSWLNLKRTSKLTLTRSQAEKDDYFIGHSYRWLGIYYQNMDLKDSAFYYYLRAEKIFKKLNSKFFLCHLYIDKALVLHYTCNYMEAEAALVSALKIAKELNIKYEITNIYMILGMNSSNQKDYISTFKYYQKALDLTKGESSEKFKISQIIILNNMAINYFYVNEYRKALMFHNESLKNNNFKGFFIYPTAYCLSLDHLANIKIKIKKNKGVEELLNKSARIRDSLNISESKDYNLFLSIEYYYVVNNLTKAKKLASKLYNLSKGCGNPEDILTSLKQLIKVDPQNALKYSSEYIRISDSMQQLERETRNKFAKIAYETEEITQQKNTAIKKYRRVWIYASIIIGLLVLLFIIKLQAAKKRELELKQIQQKANEEISNLMLDQQNKIDVGRTLEKKRIAQDLHDGIMNMLASTRINLHLLVQKTPEETRKNFNRFVDGIQDIEKEIRNIAHDLNHGALANKGSFVGISEALIEDQKNISICRYHLEIDWEIDWEKMAGYKKIHLYRIMQEALQNILKHAQAKNVEVSMRKTGDFVLMEIFDDGIGFSLNKKKKGLGLQNIMARAKASDAKAVIKTKINEGTTIEITIPIS